jgi:hypothetical protein
MLLVCFDFGADCARPQARSRISMHHAAIDYVGVFFIFDHVRDDVSTRAAVI